MSIVTEALKKAEEDKQLKETSGKTAVLLDEEMSSAALAESLFLNRKPFERKRSWKKYLLFPLIGLAAIFCLVLIVGYIQSQNGRQNTFQSNGTTYSPYQLTGISATGENRYAIVNGTIVQKADSIDGAHVVDISDEEVILKTKKGDITLNLKS